MEFSLGRIHICSQTDTAGATTATDVVQTAHVDVDIQL